MQCYACVCTICKKHWWNRLCQQEAIFCPKMSRLLSWDFSPLQIKTSWVMKSKKRAKEKTLSTALTVTDHTVAVHYIFCNKMWQDVINKLTVAPDATVLLNLDTLIKCMWFLSNLPLRKKANNVSKQTHEQRLCTVYVLSNKKVSLKWKTSQNLTLQSFQFCFQLSVIILTKKIHPALFCSIKTFS